MPNYRLRIGGDPGPVSWSIPNNDTLYSGRNLTVELATGVPSGAVYSASPDLLPGQTLELDGTTLNLVGDSTVPTVDDSVSGSPEDTISARDVVIEITDTPLAYANHIRNGSIIGTYGYGYAQPIWYAIQDLARDGDIFEISPGALTDTFTNGVGIPSSYLDNAILKINQSITVRNMTGRGRWRFVPEGVTVPDLTGIVIFGPSDITGTGWDYTPTTAGRRKTIVVEGFDMVDQFGTSSDGVRLRNGAGSSVDYYHNSVTFRNFKIGKTAGSSLSGMNGGAEYLTLEDGHVFDCGDGSGQYHNLYISAANTLTMRGVRSQRTRGWSGTPWGGGTNTVEGHMAKLDARTGVIEGCCFDAAALSDPSLLLQMKSGGNWTVRGNLFVDSTSPMVSSGAINMCREMAEDGVTPNYKTWYAGADGNSLLFEKNVFVGHYPRPIIFFFAQASTSAMRPASGGAWTAEERLDTLTIRDNIAMVATTQVSGYYPPLSGWPGTDNAMWIYQDPNAGTYWAARGNTVMTYGTDEPGFSDDDKALKLYRREAGTVAASGSVSTYRFIWPHGSLARTDAYQGLA